MSDILMTVFLWAAQMYYLGVAFGWWKLAIRPTDELSLILFWIISIGGPCCVRTS